MSLCPKCNKEFVEKYGAISRKDNKTIICPDCGTFEALEEWSNYLRKAGTEEND